MDPFGLESWAAYPLKTHMHHRKELRIEKAFDVFPDFILHITQ
jgi:hypothetical protein